MTTVFPRQGHYAFDPDIIAAYPTPDITIERISELVQMDIAPLLRAAGAGSPSG